MAPTVIKAYTVIYSNKERLRTRAGLFNVLIMSPYEFTSKTHSLSTEDLGKFFIDSFIDSLIHPSTPREPFTLNRKTPVKWRKMTRKLAKNR